MENFYWYNIVNQSKEDLIHNVSVAKVVSSVNDMNFIVHHSYTEENWNGSALSWQHYNFDAKTVGYNQNIPIILS